MASKDENQYCEICDIQFEDIESYVQHVLDDNHLAKKMEKTSVSLNPKNSPVSTEKQDLQHPGSSESSDSSEADEESITCNLCMKSFSGYIPYQHHLKGRKHIKEIEKQRVISKLSKSKEKNDQKQDSTAIVIPKTFALCSACGKEFSGPESYSQHLKSQKHLKKLAEEKFIQNVVTTNDLSSLLQSKKSNVSYSDSKPSDSSQEGDENETSERKHIEEFREKISAYLSQNADELDTEMYNTFTCTECGKAFSGLVPYMQHTGSKAHKKKLKQIKATKELTEPLSSDTVLEGTYTSTSKVDACPQRIRFLDGDIFRCDLCQMAFSGPESANAHISSRGHAKKLKNIRIKEEMKAKLLFQSSKGQPGSHTVAHDPERNESNPETPNVVLSEDSECQDPDAYDLAKHKVSGVHKFKNESSVPQDSKDKKNVSTDVASGGHKSLGAVPTFTNL